MCKILELYVFLDQLSMDFLLQPLGLKLHGADLHFLGADFLARPPVGACRNGIRETLEHYE